jgi:hypothetical protein
VSVESPVPRSDREALSLPQAAEYLLQECRMVLPGVQALFGFQLIAVFNAAFDQKLTPIEQRIHLLALALAAIAAAFIMAPAAYHRQTGVREITSAFLKLASRFTLWSMWALAISMALDFYLIARIILDNTLAPLVAAALFALLVLCWFVLPLVKSRRRVLRK